MPKPNRLWIAVDVDLLDPMGNKFGLDDPAIIAYERGLAWCKRQGTDGLIPLGVARRFLNGSAAALEAAGLIATDDEDRLVICDWSKWNEPQAQIAERRAAERERQRRFREKRDSALSTKSTKRRGEERSDNGVTPPGSRPFVTRDDDDARSAPCRTHTVPWMCVADPDACHR